MEEMDFGQMDWNYLVQYSFFGVFNFVYYYQGGVGFVGSYL